MLTIQMSRLCSFHHCLRIVYTFFVALWLFSHCGASLCINFPPLSVFVQITIILCGKIGYCCACDCLNSPFFPLFLLLFHFHRIDFIEFCACCCCYHHEISSSGFYVILSISFSPSFIQWICLLNLVFNSL